MKKSENMKKSFIALFAVALVVVASGFGLAYYGQSNNDKPIRDGVTFERGEFHEQMEEIIELGTYSDLEAFREEKGLNLVPFVTDEDSFNELKTRHAEMKAEYGEGPHFGEEGTRDGSGFHRGLGKGNGMYDAQGNGQGRGQGMHNGRGNGQGMNGDCPFMNDDSE